MSIIDAKNHTHLETKPEPSKRLRNPRQRPKAYLNTQKNKEERPLIISNNRGDMSITIEEAQAFCEELTALITQIRDGNPT